MKWLKYTVKSSAIIFAVCMLTSCGGGSSSTGTNLQSITVTPTNPTLIKGTVQQFTAIGNYSNNTSQDITALVTWESSNPNVATAGNGASNRGLVTATSVGNTNITASLNAINGSSQLSATAFNLVDINQLGVPPWYYQHPVVAINDQSIVLVAYEKEGTLLTKFYDGQSWPPIWQTLDPGALNYAPWSANDHQLVMNKSGSAGLIYRTSSNGFGFSYFNGTIWSYNQTVEAYIPFQFTQPGEVSTPIIGIDSTGTVYVAYQKSLNNIPLYVLCIARFNANGLIDVTEFSEFVWNLYLAVNANDQVMVLNAATGSRTFDGTTWGQLKPFIPNNSHPAYLKLSNSGSADFITLQHNISHFHFDGSSWGQGYRIDDNSTSSGNGAAAVDSAGNIVVAYMTSAVDVVNQIKASYFNGTTWGPAIPIDDPAIWEQNPKVLVDGAGNFVVLYGKEGDNPGIYANYFSNGSWNTPMKVDEVYGYLDPAVAMNDSGDLVIINDWVENLNLYSRFYSFSP